MKNCTECGTKLINNNYCPKCCRVIGKKVSSKEIIKSNINNNKKMMQLLLILFLVFILILILQIISIKYKNNMIILVPIIVFCSVACLFHIQKKQNLNKYENSKINSNKLVKTNKVECNGVIEDILYFCKYNVYLVKECDVTVVPVIRNKNDNKLIMFDCKNNSYKMKNDGFIYNNNQFKIGDEISYCLYNEGESKNYIKNIKFYLMGKEYSTFSVKNYAYLGKWKNKMQIIDSTNNYLLYNVVIDDLQNSLLNSIYTDDGELKK